MIIGSIVFVALAAGLLVAGVVQRPAFLEVFAVRGICIRADSSGCHHHRSCRAISRARPMGANTSVLNAYLGVRTAWNAAR